jgi:hypothetical protein
LRPRLEIPSNLDRGLWQEGAALGWSAMLIPGNCDGGSVTDQPAVELVLVAEHG